MSRKQMLQLLRWDEVRAKITKTAIFQQQKQKLT